MQCNKMKFFQKSNFSQSTNIKKILELGLECPLGLNFISGSLFLRPPPFHAIRAVGAGGTLAPSLSVWKISEPYLNRGQIMPTTLLRVLPNFQTFLRPCG